MLSDHNGPRRPRLALACLLSFVAAYLPAPAPAAFGSPSLAQRRALALLNGQSCAARARGALVADSGAASPAPSASPTPQPTPTFPAPLSGQSQLYATPFPAAAPMTPPPIPLQTPQASTTSGPVYLIRSSAPPPTIAPGGAPTGTPSPAPTAAGPTPLPTLHPGDIAVLADKFVGGTKPGTPGDAIGNVHIFYQDEVLVGDRAHYDGARTIVVSGSPYIINREQNSVLYADRITFDTIDQKATLVNGRGESSQGVEQGLVYFNARKLKSNAKGVAHGDYAFVTTCARPRSGYHITGRTIDVYPGNRIVINKAVLWLGAAAVFFLPRIVIPLRQVIGPRQRPSFFPEIGYNSYQGWYVRTKIGFGKDQYYYGYYKVEYYSKEGLNLGYVAFLQRKDGKRQTSIDYEEQQDKRIGRTTNTINVQDLENFSRTVRGNFSFAYNDNFGALTSLPATETIGASIVHAGARASQTYQYSRNSTGSQQVNDSFGFSDQRQITANLQQSSTFSYSRSQSSYGGFFSSNSSGHIDTLTHWSTKGADYQLIFDKTFANQPYGINKLPELQIRPYNFLPHFVFPITSQFTLGQYNEPSNSFTTTRADLGFVFGPVLYKIGGSDFQSTVNVDQFAYGTGDLKAAIRQNMSLSTPIGNHVLNAITYNESNYNGPASVPFQFLDQQPTQNYKGAQDILRFYNGDYYNLTLGFATNFNRMAQPVSYQLALRPSYQSYVLLGGAFSPGSGLGFSSTNVQFSTPFGRGAQLQFAGDVDWKNKGRIENKTIYYNRIIGDCYEIRVQYNQASRQINVSLEVLAFPSHTANFGINTQGPIIPTGSLNFGGP